MNEQFLILAKRLREASESRDIEAMIELDNQVKSTLQASLSKVKTEHDRQMALSVLKRYDKIYELMIKDSIKFRDEISSELKKLTRDSKAVSSYLDSSI